MIDQYIECTAFQQLAQGYHGILVSQNDRFCTIRSFKREQVVDIPIEMESHLKKYNFEQNPSNHSCTMDDLDGLGGGGSVFII